MGVLQTLLAVYSARVLLLLLGKLCWLLGNDCTAAPQALTQAHEEGWKDLLTSERTQFLKHFIASLDHVAA